MTTTEAADCSTADHKDRSRGSDSKCPTSENQSPCHVETSSSSAPREVTNPSQSVAYSGDDSQCVRPTSTGRRVHCPKTNYTYELGESVGSGAAAIVFKCRRVFPAQGDLPERVDDRELAAKVLDLRGLKLRTDCRREREKIRREVAILSRLHHPCIVNLSHVIETKDELFLIMELVKGGELFYKITERGVLSEDQARYVLLQVLSALDYMHRKGVIHRDLKPVNIEFFIWSINSS